MHHYYFVAFLVVDVVVFDVIYLVDIVVVIAVIVVETAWLTAFVFCLGCC